jgi:hypothetical protein
MQPEGLAKHQSHTFPCKNVQTGSLTNENLTSSSICGLLLFVQMLTTTSSTFSLKHIILLLT